MIINMILHLDDNILMWIEMLPSLIMVYLFFFNTEVLCLYLRCQPCVWCILVCCTNDVILSINVWMLDVAPLWVICSPPACITQAYLPHGKSEPSWPDPVQVYGISPVYLGAVKPNITVSQTFCTITLVKCLKEVN